MFIVTVMVGFSLANWAIMSAIAFFGTGSEKFDPNVTAPERAGAVVAPGVATGAWVATGAMVGVAVAELLLQAAMTVGRTVSPAAPIKPFLRTSRLVT